LDLLFASKSPFAWRAEKGFAEKNQILGVSDEKETALKQDA